jgi:regulatory protein
MIEEIFPTIYNKALDIISRREHSKKEVRDKLLKKFDDLSVIEDVIEKLIKNSLLNDSRYAEMYTRARKRKGFGPKRIGYELNSRGVSETLSSIAIKEEGGWLEAAENAFNKKFKDGISLDFKTKLKQKSFLQNRGFSFKEIDSIFS